MLLLAVEDAVSCAVETVAEAVVVAVFVVISHINAVLTLLTRCWVNRTLLGDLNLLVELDWLTLGVAGLGVVSWLCGLVLPAACLAVVFLWVRLRSGALTEVSLSYVDTAVEVDLGSWSVTGLVVVLTAVTVVDTVLNVDLGVGVALVRLTVAVDPLLSASCRVTWS